VPSPEEIDVTTSASGASVFDAALPLTDRFYTILDALYVEVRRFETEAPADEKLTPQKMVDLWERARDATKRKGGVVVDAFGRPIELRALPDELLAMTDPRVVVRDGTRRPEDIVDWVRFVKEGAR
jgi:hypothetical protein